MKNKYAKRSRISEARTREAVCCFTTDLTAPQAAAPGGLNRNIANRLYRALRERILLACEVQRPPVRDRRDRRKLLRGAAGQGPTRTRCRRQDRRLRHLRPSGPSLYRDRPGLLKANPPEHHLGPGGLARRHRLRWLARLQWLGRPRLRPLPSQSF